MAQLSLVEGSSINRREDTTNWKFGNNLLVVLIVSTRVSSNLSWSKCFNSIRKNKNFWLVSVSSLVTTSQ